MFCIMDSGEVGPDFEIGITDKTKADEKWRSESSNSEERSVSADTRLKETTPDERPTEDKPTTERQLERLHKIDQPQASRSRSIKRRRLKRKRLSRSRSSSASRGTQQLGGFGEIVLFIPFEDC